MNKFTIAMLMGVATTTGTILGSMPAYSASFSGSLTTANDIYSVFFTSDGKSTINFKSYGYNGGKNAAGTTIAAGGFDPILTIFDPNDKWYDEQNGSPKGLPDFDFDRVLAAGKYRAVLSVFENFSLPGKSFADGFPGSNLGFDGRTSAYAFDIVTRSATAVPEPVSVIGTVVAGFAAIGLKRKLATGKKACQKV
jgi:hypothetical protein